MALFCVAIRKDSVSLFRFPFLSHVQVFSCETLFIAWNVHKVVLPPIFGYFCSVDACVVCVVSGCCNQFSSALFLCSLLVVVWTLFPMLASPLYPSFLGTYILSTSSLGCKALCIVMSFFFWSICWSSSQEEVPYERDSLGIHLFDEISAIYSLASCSFLVLLWYFFLFSFISACFLMSASNISKYL